MNTPEDDAERCIDLLREPGVRDTARDVLASMFRYWRAHGYCEGVDAMGTAFVRSLNNERKRDN